MLGDRGVELALATGVVDAAGVRHRRARLRVPTGWDEGRFDAETAQAPPPEEVDEVLAGLVERLGGYAGAEVSVDLVAGLTRGDRRRLLLGLRALLDGDAIRVSARCPNPDCPEVAEVVLSVADLLGPEPGAPRPAEASVSTDDGDLLVHLPRAADDAEARAEDAWGGAGVDGGGLGEGPPGGSASGARGARAWARLVERVEVEGVEAGEVEGERGERPGRRPLTPEEWLALPRSVRVAVAEALAKLVEDAGPETALVARCPRCGGWIETEPDPADVLVRALRSGAGRLPAEVHALAYHYGWSEAAVLDLPRARRHQYLDLVVREVEGRPLTDVGGWLP